MLIVLKEGSDNMNFMLTQKMPPLASLKQKCVLILKTANAPGFEYTDETTPGNIVAMEMSRGILENLQALCNDVYMPIMSNPKN